MWLHWLCTLPTISTLFQYLIDPFESLSELFDSKALLLAHLIRLHARVYVWASSSTLMLTVLHLGHHSYWWWRLQRGQTEMIWKHVQMKTRLKLEFQQQLHKHWRNDSEESWNMEHSIFLHFSQTTMTFHLPVPWRTSII